MSKEDLKEHNKYLREKKKRRQEQLQQLPKKKRKDLEEWSRMRGLL